MLSSVIHPIHTRDNNYSVTVKKCSEVIKSYDNDKDGNLTFMEFLSLVLPLNSAPDRMEAVKREVYPISAIERLSPQIETKLTELVKSEIELNEILEIEKQELANRYDYKIETAFRCIDTKHTRYITFDSLHKFLIQMNLKIEKEDIVAFIRRVDKDLDCKVSFKEFVAAISPASTKAKLKPAYTSPTKSFQARTIKSFTKAGVKPTQGITKTSLISTKKTKKVSNSNKLPIKPATNRGNKKFLASSLTARTQYKRSNTFRSQFKNSLISPTKNGKDSRKTSHSLFKRPIKEKFTVYELMEEHLDMERRLEIMKQDLVAHDDISHLKICRILDPQGNGYVKALDFLDILRDLKLNPDRMACYSLFDRFDIDLDGMWTYDNVKDFINPISKDYEEVLDSKNSDSSSKNIRKEALAVLKRVLKTYLDMEQKNEAYKANIDKADIKKTFEEFDVNNVGYFTLENVRNFMDNVL